MWLRYKFKNNSEDLPLGIAPLVYEGEKNTVNVDQCTDS